MIIMINKNIKSDNSDNNNDNDRRRSNNNKIITNRHGIVAEKK